MVAESLLSTVLRHWPAAIFIAGTTYILSNYFNRNLNKYPGPLLASITDLWRFWDVYKRRPEVTHIKLHEKHGDVVRLGPNSLSFSNPAALKTIYGLNKGFVKSEFYPVQQSVAGGHRLPSLFSTTSEPFHSALRRSVNSAFSMTTLIQYEPFVDSTTELFLSQTTKLYAETNEPCNFSRWLQFYAFDVIGEMTYSKRHGFLEENRDIDGIVSYIANLFDYVAPIGQMPFLDLIFQKNPMYLLASKWGLVNATMPVARFAQDRIRERYPPGPGMSESSLPSSADEIKKGDKPDLLSKFIQAKVDRPEFVTDALVTTMAVSMAFAGSETTAITLSAIFYYLLKNPRSLDLLLAELDAASFESPHLVTFAEAQSLPYLDGCIKEAFRLHPAAGLPLERIVPPSGAEIAGHHIKGGVIVGCSAWVIHRNTSIFGSDVEVFRPERWLPSSPNPSLPSSTCSSQQESEEKRIKEMNGTLLHFGMGARTCIGKNISLLEVYKLVPCVLRRFEVRLEDEEKEWTLHNAWFVRQLGFDVLFRERGVVQSDRDAET